MGSGRCLFVVGERVIDPWSGDINDTAGTPLLVDDNGPGRADLEGGEG